MDAHSCIDRAWLLVEPLLASDRNSVALRLEEEMGLLHMVLAERDWDLSLTKAIQAAIHDLPDFIAMLKALEKESKDKPGPVTMSGVEETQRAPSEGESVALVAAMSSSAPSPFLSGVGPGGQSQDRVTWIAKFGSEEKATMEQP